MRPDLIVVRSVSLQDVAQVRFAEHDEVVKRFAAYRSDQPLYVAVLPWRSRGGRVISYLHRTNAAGVGWTEDSVAVANQVTRRFVPGESISHLTRNPLGRRIARHADAHQSPSGVAEYDQAVEQLERDRSHHEKIKRSNAISVIA